MCFAQCLLLMCFAVLTKFFFFISGVVMSQVNGNYFNSIDNFLCIMHHQVLLGMPWCDLQGCWILNTSYLFTLFFFFLQISLKLL